jgi:hypothetical protein
VCACACVCVWHLACGNLNRSPAVFTNDSRPSGALTFLTEVFFDQGILMHKTYSFFSPMEVAGVTQMYGTLAPRVRIV